MFLASIAMLRFNLVDYCCNVKTIDIDIYIPNIHCVPLVGLHNHRWDSHRADEEQADDQR